MKKFTFLVAFLLLSLVSFGQTAIQYGFSATTGTYTELASPTVLAASTTDSGATSLDDVDYRVTFPAGFSFSYLGTAQTDLNINTNGYVGFGTVLWTGYTYTPLSSNPGGGTTNGILSAFGLDLNAYSSTSTAPGSLSWKVEGTGTDEVFVVQYKNFKRYENSSTVDRLLNFQIRLYESTHATKPNHIEFVYGNCAIGDTVETGIDVGIRTGSTGWAANVNSVMLGNTPVGTTCTWANPVTANNNTAGMIFSSANNGITIPNGLTYTFYPQVSTAPNPVRTFAATTFTSTSAIISWTAPTGATSYNVQYRPVGACSWTNFSGNPVSGTTATITGLTQSVSYQVRVQASNGTVNSIWSHIPNTGGGGDGYSATGTFTATPTCIAPTAFAITSGSTTPFGATFTWTASTSAPSSGYDYYVVANSAVPLPDTAPTGTGSTGTTLTLSNLSPLTSYYIYVRSNCGGGAVSAWSSGITFSTPATCLAPSALTVTAASTTPYTAVLTWTASTSNPAGGYDYYRSTTSTAPTTATVPTGNQATGTSLSLTGLTPQTTYYVWVRANCGGGDTSVWSSSASFTTPATCLAPTALIKTGATATSGSFSWTASASNPGSGYDYYLATVSTAPTSATTPTGVNNGTALTINALTANTTYYLFVRANCGGGDTSVWTSALLFTTPCDPVAIPYTTSFNAATAPSCWTTQLASATQTSTKISYVTSASNPAVTPQQGSHLVMYNSYSSASGGAGAEERLISAPLTTTGINSVNLEFYWFQLNGSSYNSGAYLNEGVTPQWSTDGGTTWTSGTFIPRHVATAPASGEWAFKTITLPAGAGNQANLLVALKFHSEWGYNMYVDNFAVIATPTCSNPVAPSFVSATDASATIAWTAPAQAPANGYEYYLGTTATAPTTATVATGSVAAGVTTVTLNALTPLTTYYVWVRSKCGASLFSDWTGPVLFGTLCDSGEVVTTVPGTICGQGSTTLQATANAGATLQWFASVTGGSILATGTSYTTPVITQTTTYYVSSGNTTQNLNVAVGAGASTSGGLGASPYSHGWGGVKSQFIVRASELAAAGINPGNINSLGFTITSLGTTTLNNFAVSLGTTTQTVATTSQIDGLATVYSNAAQTLTSGFNNYTFTTPFNWDGTSNIVVQVCYSNVNFGGSSSSVQYDNVGFVSTTYTYADNQPANAICSAITGSVNDSGGTSTASTRPKITFNATALCQSARVPVIATVTTPPAVTATATDADICTGESTTLNVTSANTGYIYTWMPGNLTGATQTVSPTVDTTYTVTGFDSSSNCTVVATVFINVNALPGTLTISPAAPTVCEGTSQLLTANGATASGNAVLGTGTTAPGSTDWPNPFSAWYGGTKTQMLFKATELQAQGLVSGSSITSLSFDFSAFVAAGVCNDLRIKIGNTTVANMTSGFVASASLTTVYNATYTPSATGLIAFNLSTPFVWDGSDIIVEVAHNAGNSGNGSGNRTKATTTTFDSVYYGAKDGVAPAGVASLDAVAQADYSAKGALANRPNIVFAYNLQNSVVWAPVTGLYTNAAATTPYTGGNTTTVYAKPAASATYTATVTNAAGCTASSNVAVTVTVTAAPTAAATQTFCNTATVAGLTATGTSVQWYAAATGGTALTAATALVNGSTYYATQTLNGCESLLRTPVAVVINVTAAPTATAQTFCNGATVADLVATGTGVQWYAAATGGTALTAATALASGNYYASQTIAGCESATRTEVAVTVNVTAAPAASAQTFCNAGTVADLVATGTGVQWYAAPTGGTALTAATALASGNYYASQTLNGCESPRVEVAVTVNVTAAPVASAQTFCNAGTVADLVATGTGVQWYATATGGTALTAGTALASGNYYASQTLNGCESATRTEVAVTLNVTAPPAASAQTFCNAGTVADLVATGTGVQWYTAATGGTALTAATALASGNYYASQTLNGCESPRVEVAVVVNVTAAPAASAQAFCNDGTVADLVATGTGIQWYTAATGGTALTADTALVAGNYYASQTIAGCESATRTQVTVTISVTAAPTGAAAQQVSIAAGETATIEDLTVTAEGTVTWYASTADFAAGNAIPAGTALVDAATYFAAQTINGCTSATTLAVTVSVVLGNDKFDDKAFTYYPNPVKDVLTVSYANEISAISVVNMLGQEVISLKPNAIEAKVDMAGLADGTYIVTIRSNNAAKTVKIVKGTR